MLAQLQQVAITYVTRPRPLEWLLYLIILPVFWTLSTIDRNEPQLMAVYLSMVLAMLPAFAINNQLNWQCSHPRAMLTPNFRWPHLAIAWTLLVVFAVIAPLLAQWTSRHSVWPFLCSAALGAAFVHQSHRAMSLTTPLCIVAIYSQNHFDNAAVANWLNAVGYRRPVLITSTLLAWALVVVRDLAITRQREDDRSYRPPVVADRGKVVSRAFRTARERAASIDSARRLDRSWWTSSRTDRRIAAASQLSAWRKLHIAFDEPKAPLKVITGWAMILAMWAAIAYSSSKREGAWDAERLPGLTYFAALILSMIAVGPAISLGRRFPLMTAERLHPLSKQAYADAIVRVCLWRSVRYWLLLQTLVAVVVFALPWQGRDPIRPEHVAGYLIVSIAGLTCGCGVSLLFSLFRGLLALLLAAVIVATSTLGLQFYWSKLRPHDSQTAVLVWAAIFTAIGVGSGKVARDLWRDKEYAAALSDRFS